MLDKFADFIDLPHKTLKCPLPSDATDRIAQDQEELTAQEQLYKDNFPYRNLLGALLYLAMNTRSDIAYAMDLFLQFGAKPTLPTCKLMVYLLQL